MNQAECINELKKTNSWNSIAFDTKEKGDAVIMTIKVTGSSKKMRKARASEIKRLALRR